MIETGCAASSLITWPQFRRTRSTIDLVYFKMELRSSSYHETMEMTVAPVASAVGTGHGEMVVPSRDGLTKVQAT